LNHPEIARKRDRQNRRQFAFGNNRLNDNISMRTPSRRKRRRENEE
jgi:hypothetical protein